MTVPRSWEKAKTGHLSETARKLVSEVLVRAALLMNWLRTMVSWPDCHVAPLVCANVIKLNPIDQDSGTERSKNHSRSRLHGMQIRL